METTQTSRKAKGRKVFHLRFITKTELAKESGFNSTMKLDQAMKERKKESLLKKDGWYYSPKEMGKILHSLGVLSKIPKLRFQNNVASYA